MNSRIVCAANRCDITEHIVIGVRHYDDLMTKSISKIKVLSWSPIPPFESKVTQGFIDQFGNFYNRQKAWKIAEQNGQILRRVGGDTANGGTLYSENLY